MAIDDATVRDVARLAYLELPKHRDEDGGLAEPEAPLLDDTAVAKLTRDLSKVLDYVAQLDELDLEDVEPTSHGVPLPSRTRQDEVRADFEAQRAFDGAPMADGNAFAVPKVVE